MNNNKTETLVYKNIGDFFGECSHRDKILYSFLFTLDLEKCDERKPMEKVLSYYNTKENHYKNC